MKMTAEFLRQLTEEYKPSDDPFAKRTELGDRLKVAVQRLSPLDRNIFLLYCEDMSMAKTAKRFGVSKGTMVNELRRIKNKIKASL